MAACASGLLALTLLTPAGRTAGDWVGERLGIGDPGAPPTLRERRGVGHGKISKSIVFAAGHAPDGARYEVVLDWFMRPAKNSPPGEVFNNCLDVEWPTVPRESTSGSCGPVFPPAAASKAAIGRYISGPQSLELATKHLVLNGFTRADVDRVRVVYKDRSGRKRDAPVDFVRVRGALQRRLRADKPFGFYIAFLPPSFPRYLGAFPRSGRLRPCPDAYDKKAIELVAYDDEGIELKRVVRDNSTSGRAAC